MKSPVSITYIDTHSFDYSYWEEQNRLFNLANDGVTEYYNRCKNKESAEFWNNLENFCKYNEIPCAMIGVLYLTEKKKKIPVSITYPNIVKAIHECVNKRSDYIVRQEDQHIKLTVYYPDSSGFSVYNIWLLNKAGITAYERLMHGNGNANLTKPCYHKKLMDYLLDDYNV